MPVPFLVVTAFKSTGTYKKLQWPNSAHCAYAGKRYYYGIRTSMHIYVYVIARVGLKFGINFTSVTLCANKIARVEAECYLPINLTQ